MPTNVLLLQHLLVDGTDDATLAEGNGGLLIEPTITKVETCPRPTTVIEA
jgi:hypothetical protein